MEIFGWGTAMKPKSQSDAVDKIILSNGARVEEPMRKYQPPNQSRINNLSACLDNNFPYSDRCVPWRYAHIFKITTVRP